MVNSRISVTTILFSLIVGTCTACSTTSPSTDGLPSISSLADARETVSDHLDCLEDPPPPTTVMGDDGPIPGESVKCTQTAEIFYFPSQESRDDAYNLMAGTAETGGSVYFAEGKNWFVVDYSEVALGNNDPETLDLSVLSDPLGTRFTEVK